MNKSLLIKYFSVLLILAICILCSYGLVKKSLESRTKTELSHHQTKVLDVSEKVGLWIECERNFDYWTTGDFLGAQYDLSLYNFTQYELYDWEIELKVPETSYLDAAWNGIYHLEGDKLYISAVSYNEIIKNQVYPIGFILYIPNTEDAKDWIPTDISIVYKKYLKIQDLTSFWIFLSFVILICITIVVFVVCKIKVKEATKRQLIYKDIIEQALSTFANTIDAKDNYTEGHSRRVALFSREIARRMGFTYQQQEEIFYIAMMHDIGKIGIPDRILQKPTKLTDEEWEVMKQHPIYSGDILQEFTTIPTMSEAVRYHHEWFDGSGYPYQLKGYEIPLISRIISIADSFDTMNTKRVYRGPLETSEIIEQLQQNSGVQFDPDIVPFMIKMIEDGSVARLEALV